MTKWFYNKILGILRTKEGCTIETYVEYTVNSYAEAIVRDVLGYRYRVTVEALGRTFDDRKMDDNNNKLDFTQVV